MNAFILRCTLATVRITYHLLPAIKWFGKIIFWCFVIFCIFLLFLFIV